MESLAGKLQIQAPSSKLQRSSKAQTSTRRLDGHHIARSLVWSLRFGASLELGVWGLVLRCAPYSTENSEDPNCFVPFEVIRDIAYAAFLMRLAEILW
jgi:hypothetical protein